jgi:thioredoxin reductase (NADPH)
MSKYDVIIIGAGPAGYTAAIYTARASLKTLMITGTTPGGQLLLTSEVENFPGFKDGIMGPELMDQMKAQAKRFGVDMIQEFVTKAELEGDEKTVFVGNTAYKSKSIIISTGASANWLGLENETRLMGKGVSSCATCDGFFFKDQEVVVIGGGDSAMEEALTLANLASKVTVIHRRDEFRASKIMQQRVLDHEKISVEWDSEVVDVLGRDMVEGVEVKNIKTNKTKTIPCKGMFVAIGHTPATDLFKDVLKLDDKGYLVVKDEVKTDLDGVFAAGDVADPHYRQAITAAGDGCKAGLQAERFVQGI